MITAELRIRFGTKPCRKPSAWFVSGDDPAVWLQEIAAWRVPHDQIRLFPVPTSQTNRQTLGVVATQVAPSESPISKRCLPYGLAAERLFLPLPCPNTDSPILTSTVKVLAWSGPVVPMVKYVGTIFHFDWTTCCSRDL